MSPRSNNSINKALYQCIVAIALVMGFFSAYSSHATSQLKNITQTEWVESRSLKKVRSVFEKENKAPAEVNNLTFQSELFNLLAKNRLTHVLCKANQKLVQSIIPGINTIYFNHRPQFSDDYFISA